MHGTNRIVCPNAPMDGHRGRGLSSGRAGETTCRDAERV